MTAPAAPRDSRIPELDGLRGIAIGMVLVWHLYFLPIAPSTGSVLYYLHTLGRLMWTGVDLFFVLSGFLIGGILLDNRAADNYFKVFYIRRFFRIVPVYLVSLGLFYIFVRLLVTGATSRFRFLLFLNILPWVPHIFFLQNFWMAVKNTSGILVITWSLCIEEQFYLTLPLLVRLLHPRRLFSVVCAAIVAAPLLRLAILLRWPDHHLAAYVLLPCRADALMLGVLGALLVRHPPSNSWLASHRLTMRWLLALAALGLFVLLIDSPFYDSFGMQVVGYSWVAVSYLALLFYAVAVPAGSLSACLRWSPLCQLGGLAYAIYLFHMLVIWILFGSIYSRWPSIHNLRSLFYSFLALLIIWFLAKLSWKYFEKPLIHFGHRSRYRFQPGPQPLSGPAPEPVGP